MGYGNKSIKDWAEEVHAISRAHGWYDESKPKRSVGDFLVLIHSEVSEALEAYRENGFENWYEHYLTKTKTTRSSESKVFPGEVENQPNKPCGIASEMADIVIRVFDFCEAHKIDIERAIREKSAYNETRSYRHGGKAL